MGFVFISSFLEALFDHYGFCELEFVDFAFGFVKTLEHKGYWIGTQSRRLPDVWQICGRATLKAGIGFCTPDFLLQVMLIAPSYVFRILKTA